MIKYITKNLTTVTHGIVAHGCNCRGKMGKGIAKAIKEKWPKAFSEYIATITDVAQYPCGVTTGAVIFVQIEETPISQVIVANMLTQKNYGNDPIRYADPEAIRKAMIQVLHRAKEEDLPVYMSRVGCNLGGLNWETDVQPIIEELDNNECTIFVCDY